MLLIMARTTFVLETLPRRLWRNHMEVEVEDRSTEGKVAVNLLKFWRKITSLENMFGTIIK